MLQRLQAARSAAVIPSPAALDVDLTVHPDGHKLQKRNRPRGVMVSILSCRLRTNMGIGAGPRSVSGNHGADRRVFLSQSRKIRVVFRCRVSIYMVNEI